MNTEVIIAELDRLYVTDINKYNKECSDLKRMGHKIYRNSVGKHKIIPKIQPTSKEDIINNAFGDIFGDIFKGKA